MYWDDVVITAAHNVYDYGQGEWANWVTAYPGKNYNSNTYGSAEIDTMYVTNGYYNYGYADEDMGVIELDWDIGADTGYFGSIYYYEPRDEFYDKEIRLSGYPYVDPNGRSGRKEQRQGYGDTMHLTNSLVYQHTADTGKGQSGSPIFDYFSDADGYLAYGVHTEDYSYGSNGYNGWVVLNEYLYDWINSYRD